MERMALVFRRTVETLLVLTPLLLALYLWTVQQPPLVLRAHLPHELAILLACMLGGFVTAIAWYSHQRTGEVFARFLTLAVASFTCLYAFHGLLTRMDDHNMWLFILLGPAARLMLAALITIGALSFDRPPDTPRRIPRGAGPAAAATLLAGLGVTALALSPWAAEPLWRQAMEGATISLCALAILRLVLRPATFGMKGYVIAGLALTAQSSLIFLMTPAWTHLWWLGHATGAAGFLVLCYGVARSESAGWSLTRLFSEREMRAELDQARRLSTALRRAKEEAEAASRSKSAFLAAMSHELRTPLNAIIGFSDMMRGETLGPLGAERYREYSALIGDSGRHLLDVINDVLDVSRIETGALTLDEGVVDLEQTVDAALSMIRDRAEAAHLSLGADLPRPAPRLRGDARRIKQILLNLLSNAVKFSTDGGAVNVTAAVDDRGGLRVVVADTGIGMAPEDIPTALEVFGQVDSRLERRFEGTGLGLPLSASLMALHDGRLDVDSAPGQGTRVTLTFPAQRVLAAEAPAPRDQRA